MHTKQEPSLSLGLQRALLRFHFPWFEEKIKGFTIAAQVKAINLAWDGHADQLENFVKKRRKMGRWACYNDILSLQNVSCLFNKKLF